MVHADQLSLVLVMMRSWPLVFWTATSNVPFVRATTAGLPRTNSPPPMAVQPLQLPPAPLQLAVHLFQ